MESRIFIVPQKGHTFSAEDKQRIEADLKEHYGPDVKFSIFDGNAIVGDYEPFVQQKYEAPAKETPRVFYGLSVLHGDLPSRSEWMESILMHDNNGSFRPVFCGPVSEELVSHYNLLPYSYSVIPRPYSSIYHRYPSVFQFNYGKWK